jgi:hypothetical protein
MGSPVPMTDDALTLVLAPDSKTGYAGVIEAKPGKSKPFQARMYCMEKKAQRALPGLYETAEEAARVLAKAKRDGFTWDAPPAERAARGTRERTQRPRIKKWNHGAPLTKKVQCPGIGRGNHPNSKLAARTNNVGRTKKKDDVLTTVPLPCTRDEVRNPSIAEWLMDYDGTGE